MENNSFKVGDVVKSAERPIPMTIDRISDAGIECVWHEEKQPKRKVFKAHDLKEAKTEFNYNVDQIQQMQTPDSDLPF